MYYKQNNTSRELAREKPRSIRLFTVSMNVTIKRKGCLLFQVCYFILFYSESSLLWLSHDWLYIVLFFVKYWSFILWLLKEYKRDVDYIFGDEHDDRTMKKMHLGHENDINDLRIVVLGIMSGYWVYDIIVIQNGNIGFSYKKLGNFQMVAVYMDVLYGLQTTDSNVWSSYSKYHFICQRWTDWSRSKSYGWYRWQIQRSSGLFHSSLQGTTVWARQIPDGILIAKECIH